MVHRGVALWEGPGATEERVFISSRDKLWALDAATGLPVQTFGRSGVAGISSARRREGALAFVTTTSPPAVVGALSSSVVRSVI